MNKRQKILAQNSLNSEETVLKRLEYIYDKSRTDINAKIRNLQFRIDELTEEYDWAEDAEKDKIKSKIQSKIYQKQYQEQLQKQVDGILNQMQTQQYVTIADYLNECYSDGFVGTIFDMHGQGVPLTMPINQESMVKAIQLDSKISKGLYTKLGVDVATLKKRIAAQVTRGIANGSSFREVAEQLNRESKIGRYKSMRIARTEGHRIQNTAIMDASYDARDRGADLVKQWDATLDGKTRDSHVAVDMEIRELDEAFSNGLMYPSDPAGSAAEVINCRCRLNQRARWALGGSFTKFNNFTKQIEEFESPEAYEDFKKGFFSAENKEYMNYVQQMEKKYGKDFKTVLEQMNEREYNHYSKLLKSNPVYNKQAMAKEVDIADINLNGSNLMVKAYEYHRTKNGMTSTPYENMGEMAKNIVYADYGKLSVESAKAFNDTLSELVNEYDTPIQKIRTMTKDELLGHGNAFAFVQHNYTVDSAELVIHTAKCKDLNSLTEKIKELSKRNYCVKIPDDVADKYIPTHEFAHTLLHMQDPLSNKTNWLGADYGKIKKARKEINTVYEKYMVEVEQLTKTKKSAEMLAMTGMDAEQWQAAAEAAKALNAVKISNYSLENVDEFLAESFANEKLGIGSNPYSKEVLAILDKYFKR